MDDADLSQRFAAAQLAHIQLQSEKLVLDLATQRREAGVLRLPQQAIPLMTLLLSVCGFVWGLMQYVNEQERDRDAQRTQSHLERQTREKELMKPWLETQRATYAEALSAASKVANTRDPKERAVAEQTFWQLYQGRMILVETTTVSDRMVRFGRCLDGTETCTSEEMNKRTRALATAMADSMAATAEMSYQDFAKNQFRYVPGRSLTTSP